MNRPTDTTQDPSRRDDALLNRYQEANAHDPLRPHPALREAVLTHAKNHQPDLENSPRPALAANDSQWKIRALGSVAVMGLVGLLVMQFERGTPDEKSAALGTPAAQERRAEAAPPVASPPAPEPAFASSDPVVESAAPAASPRPAPPAKGLAPRPSGNVTKTEDTSKFREAEAAPASAAARPPAADPATPMPEPMAAPTPMPKAAEADRLAAAPPPSAMAAAGSALEIPPMTRARPAEPLADAAAVEAPKAKSAAATSHPTQRPAASMATPLTQPPLHAAAEQGDLEALKVLLAKGFDIDARNAQGQTALMLAAAGQNQALLMALLTAGADKTPTDRSGLTAAAYAERANHRDWLPLLQP